ncbi:DMT family transporter [Alkalispirochaeta alkalica]|uniref:DMT family transporter n=1 Tax=Alkalispirochaeta alkalica TaxID=46356 RepID=UPI00039BC15E|nr:DMT family transporter [Alkalispirochaeta alkalica]
MNVHIIGQTAALATALCWAITSLSFEAAGKRVGSLQVNLLRLAFALPVFTAYLVARQGQIFPGDADWHIWFWLSSSGIVGFFLGDLFLFQAFVDVGARMAMLIYASVPPMTALLGWLILGEALTPGQFGAMAVTMAGIVLVTTVQPPGPPKSAAPSPAIHHPGIRGIWFALLGSLGQALGLVLSRFGAPDYDPFAATQIRALAGFVAFLLFFLFTGRLGRALKALRDAPACRHILRGAFFGPFLGVSLGLLAAQNTSTAIASTIMATVPIILIPITVFGFRQTVTLRELAGALLAVAGVALLFTG